MVLFKRKPVRYLSTPEIDDEDQEVWVIDATGEIFTEYDDYLNRMQFYKSKRFICEITGHSGLDFFSALESEVAGSKDVEESFPEPLKGPILRKVQFQTISRVDNLVDVVYDYFKDDFYPGEIVIATLHNNDRTEGQIREKMSFPEQRSANGEISKPAAANYTVNLINRGEEVILSGDNLVRDRRIFTKAMLRAFIKNTVFREAWNGAPWLVKDYFAKKFCINQNIPRHLQRGSTVAERKAMVQVRRAQAEKGLALAVSPDAPPSILRTAPPSTGRSSKVGSIQASGKGKNTILSLSSNGILKIQPMPETIRPPPRPVVKYPLEDLTIMATAHPKPRPSLSQLHRTNFGGKINEESVPLLLETWIFLNVYCEPFLLDSFTFDDYAEALLFTDDTVDCLLLVEIHCAMLKALVAEGDNGQVKIKRVIASASDDDAEEETDEQPDSGDEDAEEDEEEAEVPLPRRTTRSSVTNGFRAVNAPAPKIEPRVISTAWKDLIRKRDFKDGGWETCLVGLTNSIKEGEQVSDLAAEILSHFSAPSDDQPLWTAKEQYKALDVNVRIKAVQFLQKLTFETPIVREFMDECNEHMTKLRKDKIEHQKLRKVYIEELKLLDEERKILDLENVSATPTKDTESSGDVDVKMINGFSTPTELKSFDDDGDDSDMSRPARRASNRAVERKRKREQEKEREEANAKLQQSWSKQKKVALNIEKTKQKIKQEEADVAELDNDIREADCARLRLLGRDRYWNRYWYLERNGMPYKGLPDSSTADSGYAMGRLWLQGATEEEQREFLDLDKPVRNYTDDDTKVAISVRERRKREEGDSMLRGPDKWAYIDKPEDLAKLVEWLDPRGERELKLKKELDIYKEHIISAMNARLKYLTPDTAKEAHEAVVRMSTRTKHTPLSPTHRCLRWRNDLAKEKLGHTHLEQPHKSKSSRKK